MVTAASAASASFGLCIDLVRMANMRRDAWRRLRRECSHIEFGNPVFAAADRGDRKNLLIELDPAADLTAAHHQDRLVDILPWHFALPDVPAVRTCANPCALESRSDVAEQIKTHGVAEASGTLLAIVSLIKSKWCNSVGQHVPVDAHHALAFHVPRGPLGGFSVGCRQE